MYSLEDAKHKWAATDFLPAVEAVVDDRVVHGGAHGQPHDGQVNLLDVSLLEQIGEELMQQEVDMIGQPADGERTHNHDHHLHHLPHTKTHKRHVASK